MTEEQHVDTKVTLIFYKKVLSSCKNIIGLRRRAELFVLFNFKLLILRGELLNRNRLTTLKSISSFVIFKNCVELLVILL